MAGEVQILQREGDRIHVLHRIDLRTSGYRMAVSWPVLWILDGKTLRAFDVSDPSASNLLATHSLGADYPTLAVSGRCLWVATNTLQRFMLHGPVADRIAAPLPTVAPPRPMPDPSAWPAGRRLSLPWVGQARALSVTEQCR
jgi:hypothetical protein